MDTSDPQTAALDFIRPHRVKWIPPLAIMRLPPTDFQGYHIEVQGEVLHVTGETGTYVFSLKKLIVQIEKELNRLPERLVPTPRDLAKLLIRGSVESHESLEYLAHSGHAMGWYGYDVSVGGLVSARTGPGGKYEKLKVDCWHILVSEFEGEDCVHLFDLREIYRDLELEIKRGFIVEQLTLF